MALQSTNSKNESNKSPSEFLASYQSNGLESYDLKKSFNTLATTLDLDKSPNSNKREDEEYEQ